jgi:hypothetical protein
MTLVGSLRWQRAARRRPQPTTPVMQTGRGAHGNVSGKTRTYYIAADEVQWDYRTERQEPHHGRAVR